MIAVVRGNDFRLRVPIRRNVVHNNGTTSYEPLDISALNDLHVFLEDETMCAKELSWFIDTENTSSIIADVPACMQEGKYALILLGKYSDDRHFRSKERKQLRLVETNEQANITPFDLDGFDAYALDTMIIMDGRGRDGLTAYEIAVAHGYTGTEEEWLESLHNVSEADKERWNSKQDALTFDNLPTQGSNNPVKSGGVYSKIQDLTTTAQITRDNLNILSEEVAGKQNTLTFDNTPTANSDNPVKSGGVYNRMQTLTSAIQQVGEDVAMLQQEMPEKQNVLTFDNTPTANSNNPVKSGGIKSAIDGVQTVAQTALNKINAMYPDQFDGMQFETPGIYYAYPDFSRMPDLIPSSMNHGSLTGYLLLVTHVIEMDIHGGRTYLHQLIIDIVTGRKATRSIQFPSSGDIDWSTAPNFTEV